MEDSELRAAVWRDVQTYQAKQREERRMSVAWHITESKRQKEVPLFKQINYVLVL
jgi:hypothetical protein